MTFSPIRKLYHCDDLCPFPEASIQGAIKRIGRLPAVLVEYYRQLGDNDEINQIQDNLYGPASLGVEDGYLTFYIEEQESMWWAIKEADLGMDDPPVYACLWENGGYTYLPESDSLTKFLCAMAFSHAALTLPFNSEGPFVCDEARKARLEQHYAKKDFSLSHSPRVTFYGNADDEVIMLCEDDDCQVSFGCTTREQLEKIQEVLQIKVG